MVTKDITTEADVFEYAESRFVSHNGRKEDIPLKILWSGFASWLSLLEENFPSELWPDNEHGTPMEEVLFRRFAEVLLSRPAFNFLTEVERGQCVQAGWETWVEN